MEETEEFRVAYFPIYSINWWNNEHINVIYAEYDCSWSCCRLDHALIIKPGWFHDRIWLCLTLPLQLVAPASINRVWLCESVCFHPSGLPHRAEEKMQADSWAKHLLLRVSRSFGLLLLRPCSGLYKAGSCDDKVRIVCQGRFKQKGIQSRRIIEHRW